MQRIYQYGFTALFVAVIACLNGCGESIVQGNGQVSEQTYLLKPIDSLTIDGNYTVHIQQGSQNSATIQIDDNLQKHIQLDQQDSQLTIENDAKLKTSHTVQINLTVTNLTQLDIHGETIVNIQQLTTPKLSLSIKGHHQIALSGKARDLRIKAAGDNQVDTTNFKAKGTIVQAEGHNAIRVYCQEGFLTVKADGSNQIGYFGRPMHIQQQTSDNSSVTELG